jgi:hypothetical protein
MMTGTEYYVVHTNKDKFYLVSVTIKNSKCKLDCQQLVNPVDKRGWLSLLWSRPKAV